MQSDGAMTPEEIEELIADDGRIDSTYDKLLYFEPSSCQYFPKPKNHPHGSRVQGSRCSGMRASREGAAVERPGLWDGGRR